MAIELQTNQSALEQLKTIDSMARSASGRIAGNIGLVDGHVVKFNTHWQERLFSRTTNEMREASSAMRETLKDLIGKIFAGDQQRIDRLDALIDGKGGLLDRAVVAKVVDEVAASGKGEPRSSIQAIRDNASTDRRTDFATVRGEVSVLAAHRDLRNQIVDQLRPLVQPYVDKRTSVYKPLLTNPTLRGNLEKSLDHVLREFAEEVIQKNINLAGMARSRFSDEDFEQLAYKAVNAVL